MHAIGKYNKNIYVDSDTSEIYLSLSRGFNYVFNYSFQFLPTAPPGLAENLRKDAGEIGFKFALPNFGQMQFLFYYLTAFIPMSI